MIRMLMAVLALMVIVPQAAAHDVMSDRDMIMGWMLESAAGWNVGDLDIFLSVYSDDPATSFTTDKGVARGKAGIRARYLSSYAGQFGPDRKAPSKLTFTFEDLRFLGKKHAVLIARWTLTTPGKADPDTGMTSLVFRKEKRGWRIIADHSS